MRPGWAPSSLATVFVHVCLALCVPKANPQCQEGVALKGELGQRTGVQGRTGQDRGRRLDMVFEVMKHFRSQGSFFLRLVGLDCSGIDSWLGNMAYVSYAGLYLQGCHKHSVNKQV